jgi:hypothetical protein
MARYLTTEESDMKKTKTTGGGFQKPIDIEVTLVAMLGSPLVTHQFSEKAKQSIRDKQSKKGRAAKEARDPEADFQAAKYFDAEDREAIPVTSVKKALVTAGTAMDDLTKVGLRQSLFVAPTAAPASHLIPIEGKDGKPLVGIMREDAVTIGQGTHDLRYRPEYRDWQIRVTISYQPALISESQLLMLIDHAGWGVGIGEGRPEKTSALGWGRFCRAEK